MKKIRISTQDGISLYAWYKPAKKGQATILYLHGNAGHIGHRMVLAHRFLNAGLGVFLLEYRGYGGNSGKPSEEGLYTDARAAIHYLRKEGISAQQTVLYGESLGSAVATKMATETPVCALVLQSPFTSLSAVARYHYPWVLIKPQDKFDSLDRIAKIHSPILILHGRRDKVVPFNHSVMLYQKANSPKKIIPFNEKGHNDLWDDYFSNQVIEFIQSRCDENG